MFYLKKNSLMDIKLAIIDRLSATKHENMVKLFNYMNKNGVFTRPCYRHHHYEGGLADHDWHAYQVV